mgnify:CR=1 FL=1
MDALKFGRVLKVWFSPIIPRDRVNGAKEDWSMLMVMSVRITIKATNSQMYEHHVGYDGRIGQDVGVVAISMMMVITIKMIMIVFMAAIFVVVIMMTRS